MKRKQQSQSQSQKEEYDISRQAHEENKSELDDGQFIVPNSNSYLKACIHCGLTKSKSQWQATKNCQNCGTFMKIESNQNTTSKIYGMIALIDPKRSFIRKKARIYARNGRKIKPGAYAI